MPLTVADLKRQLNVTIDDDDQLLADKLEAATAYVEEFVGPLADFEDGVPKPVEEAILMYGAHLYENREAVQAGSGFVTATPLGFDDLLSSYRSWAF